MKTDFHVHSAFSDDSHEPMEEQIKRAIELGFDEICFTDHVDYGVKKDWFEEGITYRHGDGILTPLDSMEPNVNVNYPEYFKALHRYREEYAGKITIRQGLEFGIQTMYVDKFKALYDKYEDELDFILLSVHQVDDREFWNQDFQRGKTQQEFNEAYYREIYDVMSLYDRYCILAHLDHMVRYDEYEKYPFEKIRDIVTEILKKAIAEDKGIEINTSSWHYDIGDTTPSRDILKLYRELGGRIITIGSDAHSVRYLGDHFGDAVQILKDIGFREFATYEKMVPTFHPL